MTASYAFFSVKGGVGKSALAAAAAVAFAREGRTVAVIDADLSGTSLADGLALRAPQPVNGKIAWQGPPQPHLSRKDTLTRRRDHGEVQGAGALPFFDALVTTRPRPEFHPVGISWIHDDMPSIRWYPSSPAPRDTTAAVQAMMVDDVFGRRLGPSSGCQGTAVGGTAA